MKKRVTNRGFGVLEFKDRNDVECSIQESSLGSEKALWLGPNEGNPKILASKTKEGGTGWVPYKIPEDVLLTTRAHLTRPMVKKIIVHLERWLKTGNLIDKDE